MSPLEVRAERRFGVEIYGPGDQLEYSPVKKIRVDGQEEIIDPVKSTYSTEEWVGHKMAYHTGLWTEILPEETIVVPNFEWGEIWLVTDRGMAILQEFKRGASGPLSTVNIMTQIEGTGIQRNGEVIPVARDDETYLNRELKEPVPVWTKGEPLANVSWSEE